MTQLRTTTRHFLRDDDLSPDQQTAVLDLADRMKADRFGWQPLAGPRSVAVVFDKPSTRTRVSFSVGVAELGGYPLVIDAQSTQLGRGEPIEDTTRVLDRQCAAIVWRTAGQDRIDRMAAVSQVPVVNALTDSFHPCQILADLQTVREHKGRLAGLTLAYLGDGANNMAHSYLVGGAVAGMHVRVGSPAGYDPDPEILATAQRIAAETGGSATHVRDAAAAATAPTCSPPTRGCRWARRASPRTARRRSTRTPWTRLRSRGPPSDAIVLHCLPAYRGKEIAAAVIDGPQSVVWDEAENRLHAQKALLTYLLEQT